MNKLLTDAPTKENDKEKEKMKKYLSLMLTVIIMVSMLAGCERREAADTSDRTFSVLHFSGHSQWERKLSATNGNTIFYVDGDNIFQLGKAEPALTAEGEICSLTVSESRLYVPYDKPGYIANKTLVMYEISTGETQSLEVDNIEAVAAHGEYMFGAMKEYLKEENLWDKYVACASEKYPVDVSYFHTFHSIASESDVPVGELAQCVFGDRENMVVYCNGQLSICITIKSITTIIYCTKYMESTVQL